MKAFKLMLPWFILFVFISAASAQQRIPSSMVLYTNTSSTLPTGTLSQVLSFIDTNLQPSVVTNYAPRATTNLVPSVYTPRWTGDMLLIYGGSVNTTQVWQSWGTATTTWFMVYPVTLLTTTNYDYTNSIIPRYVGDEMQCTGKSNIIWHAFNGTSVTNWKKVYEGAP